MKSIALLLVLAPFLLLADDKNLLKPTNKTENWRLEQHEGAKAEMKADDESIVFRSTTVGSAEWHIQAVQTGLDLKEGSTYVLKFKARSPDRVYISVNAMIDQDDWHQIGLHEEINLEKEYKDYSYEFQATGTVAKKNRISFVLGYGKGEVQVKDVSLTAK